MAEGTFPESRGTMMRQIVVVDSEHVDRWQPGEIGQAARGIDREQRTLGAESLRERFADDLALPLPPFLARAHVHWIDDLKEREREEAQRGHRRSGAERSLRGDTPREVDRR